MIWSIISTILGIGGDVLERRQRLKEVKIDAESKVLVARAEAEIKRLQNAQDAEVNWDQTVANQMQSSWKDEWFTIMLSVPVMLAFMGEWGRKSAEEGFAAISTMPDWYKVAFMTAIAASFGVRALVNHFGFGKK